MTLMGGLLIVLRRIVLSTFSVVLSFLAWGTVVARTENLIARLSGIPLVRPGHMWTLWGGLIVLIAAPVTAFATFGWLERRFPERRQRS